MPKLAFWDCTPSLQMRTSIYLTFVQSVYKSISMNPDRILAFRPPNPHIKIRPVLKTDKMKLVSNCWPERTVLGVQQVIARAQLSARQGRGLGIVVVDQITGDIVAYGQITLWARAAEISDLIVKESHRGGGIGTAMIQYLLRVAQDMNTPAVEVGAALSNPRALALYRRLGFQDDHIVMVNLGDGYEEVLYLKLDFD